MNAPTTTEDATSLPFVSTLLTALAVPAIPDTLVTDLPVQVRS